MQVVLANFALQLPNTRQRMSRTGGFIRWSCIVPHVPIKNIQWYMCDQSVVAGSWSMGDQCCIVVQECLIILKRMLECSGKPRFLLHSSGNELTGCRNGGCLLVRARCIYVGGAPTYVLPHSHSPVWRIRCPAVFYFDPMYSASEPLYSSNNM